MTTVQVRATRLSNAGPAKTLFYQLAVAGAALLVGAGIALVNLPGRAP